MALKTLASLACSGAVFPLAKRLAALINGIEKHTVDVGVLGHQFFYPG